MPIIDCFVFFREYLNRGESVNVFKLQKVTYFVIYNFVWIISPPPWILVKISNQLDQATSTPAPCTFSVSNFSYHFYDVTFLGPEVRNCVMTSDAADHKSYLQNLFIKCWWRLWEIFPSCVLDKEN